MMSMKLKNLPQEQTTKTDHGGGSTDAPRVDSRNVLVTHGIHRGRFPIGGMRIREARETLAKLINISPDAVPVINGTPVDESTVIDDSKVSMLAFVKPSALKG